MDSRTPESVAPLNDGPTQHESDFYLSLRQLRSQLDDMNRRTALLLQNGREQTNREVCTDSLSLPTGPAFWQLYQALRSDLRGLDARVELVEDRIQSISDRLDALEPVQLTPLGSPTISGGNADYAASTIGSNNSNEGSDTGKPCPSRSMTNLAASDAPLADVSDIGFFCSPGYSGDDRSEPLATNDVFTFMARLRRVSRTKRIVTGEASLRGAAQQMYRLGYRSDGTNDYEEDDGHVKLYALEQMLLNLHKSDATESMDRQYTVNNMNNFTPLKDWALTKLLKSRDLDASDEIERQARTFDYINDGIEIPTVAQMWLSPADRPKSVLELMVRLRDCEVAIAASHEKYGFQTFEQHRQACLKDGKFTVLNGMARQVR